MNTDIPHGTAQIYEFPRRVAANDGLRRGDSRVVSLRLPQVATVEFGSGWYHEAAVQDANRVRKP